MDVTLHPHYPVPPRILADADEDRHLDGFVDPTSGKPRTGILVDGELVGFFTPRERDGYHRTGAIYVLPEFQGRGIGKRAIALFFAGKKGEACIDDDNHASLAAFRAAGFVQDKPYGLGAHWYVKELRHLENFRSR